MTNDPDVLNPNAVALTTKELLIEVFHDMKFVRPAVEGLLAANIQHRLEAVEKELAYRNARGLSADLVARVEVLEAYHDDEESRAAERERIGSISGRAIAGIVLFGQALGGLLYFIFETVVKG